MIFDSYIVSDTKTAISMPLTNNCPAKLKKNKGFTLAETLITLTIIGVVAALTIPTLMNKYTKHTYVVGLKKAYAQLSNAMKMMPITEGCSAGDYDCVGFFEEWGKATNIDGMEFNGSLYKKSTYLLSKQFKTTKVCLDLNQDNCPALSTATMEAAFITQDGMCFYGDMWSSYVDINCQKGPNKAGRDIFFFVFANETRDGVAQGLVMPYGSKVNAEFYNQYYWEDFGCTTESVANDTTDHHCTGRVLEEDAMNY